MSIRYALAKSAVKAIGIKKIFSLPSEKLLEKAEQLNRSRQFKMPRDRKARYEDRVILGHHCLSMEIGEARSDRAMLFLFGGGMIIGSDAGDVKAALQMGMASGRDVWFPYYPLCTHYSMLDAVKMVYETYTQMLERYAAEKIAVVGFSSGAGLALDLITYINRNGRKLPMPEMLILSSPGTCPATEEDFAAMQELNAVDVLIDATYMKTAGDIMRHGDPDVPDELIYITTGDFTGAPMTHFFYGENEVLRACAEPFARAFEKVGAKYTMHIELGMCHCYPMVTFFPEGKRGNDELIRLLK